ncbi:MAG: shikimate kinase [Treponema sp.]|jgi:shikimate kinase|nr:shikimate kinase [Treponema sp.]
MLVIITGPKHAGKTSAGKALARLLAGDTGVDAPAVFIDLDELVERRSGKSPRQLYREGPECFRREEAAALRSLLEDAEAPQEAARPDKILIVATGGGIADNPEALTLLTQAGSAAAPWTVYIDLPVETAWERIRTAADGLPPFLDTPDPQETHRVLHERRGKIYRELAGITVKAGNTPEETAAKILRALPAIPLHA